MGQIVTANQLLALDEEQRDNKIRKVSEKHMMEEKQLLRNMKKQSLEQSSHANTKDAN